MSQAPWVYVHTFDPDMLSLLNTVAACTHSAGCTPPPSCSGEYVLMCVGVDHPDSTRPERTIERVNYAGEVAYLCGVRVCIYLESQFRFLTNF